MNCARQRLYPVLLVLLVFVWALARDASALEACKINQIDGGPVAASDEYPFPSGAVEFDVLENDSDANGDELVIISVSSGGGGTVAVAPGGKRVVFTPATGATSGAFTYTIQEVGSTGGVANATVTMNGSVASPIEVTCNSTDCSFRVTPAVTDGISGYDWTFGDGGKTPPGYNIPTALHRYNASGSYQVSVRVRYASGAFADSTRTVSVVQTRDLTWSYNNSEGSYVAIRIDTTWVTEWDTTYSHWIHWGDGEVTYFNNHDAVGHVWKPHVYETDDLFQVKIEVRASNGEPSEFYSKWIPVANAAPVPHITALDPSARKTWTLYPHVVQYGDLITTWDEMAGDGPWKPQPYEWDFGDGEFTVGGWRADGYPDAVTHTFRRPGRYRVRLKVTDYRGAVGEDWYFVDVPNTAPTASFLIDCSGRTCWFDGSGSQDDAGVTQYTWTFGTEGTVTTTTPQVSHTFAADGRYNIALTVSDGTFAASTGRVAAVTSEAISRPLFFYALAPCRQFDSRLIPPRLASGVVASIPMTGKCPIPANAVAVAANVTVFNPAGDGYIQPVYPGKPHPIASVNTFMYARPSRAANAILQVANGRIHVKPIVAPPPGTAADTDLVVDVTGYFADFRVGTPAPLGFDSVSPCRIYDSRTTNTPITNPNTTYLKVRGNCNIPESFGGNEAAAALNLALIGATHVGWSLLYPSSLATMPAASTINPHPQFMNMANGSLSALGQRGGDDIALYYKSFPDGGSTQFVVDTTGYFSTTGASKYFPVTPCRIMDTRHAEYGMSRPVAGTPQKFQIRGNCNIPQSATAVAVNAAVVLPDGSGHLKLYPSDLPQQPPSASLNYAAGEHAISNLTIVPLGASAPELTALTSVSAGNLVLDVYGFMAPASAPPIKPKDASVVNHTIPAVMVTGLSYPVTVTLRNSGTTPWSPVGAACGAFRYGNAESLDWGVAGQRVELPAGLEPEQEITLHFTLKAPANAGVHTFAWRMVQECVEWFGEQSNIPVEVRTPQPKDAAIVGHTIPPNMIAGQLYPVTVTLRNTGSSAWSPAPGCGTFRYGGVGPTDWGVAGQRVELPAIVQPGQEVTLQFTVKAPASAGSHPFVWRMVHECVEWFGEQSAVWVAVRTPAASEAYVVSAALRSTMVAGQRYPVTVTLRNVGSQSWSPVGPACQAYRFGSQTANSWGVAGARVELTAPVPAGQETTLQFEVTAPTTPGVHRFDWRMVQECVQWFGDPVLFDIRVE